MGASMYTTGQQPWPMDAGIPWTSLTLNPGIYGCQEVSPACKHCYAAKMAHRLSAQGRYPAGITKLTPSGVKWTGKVVADPARLVGRVMGVPARTARLVFVTSMSDVGHRDVPDDFRAAMVGLMLFRRQHQWQLLTKRPERLARFLREYSPQACLEAATELVHSLTPESPLVGQLQFEMMQRPPQRFHNIWFGATVEDQRRASERMAAVIDIWDRVAVTFLSVEPLLQEIDLTEWLQTRYMAGTQRRRRVDWMILGGESGNERTVRPLDLDAMTEVMTTARLAGTATFIKQLGSRWARAASASDGSGAAPEEWPTHLRIRQFPRPRAAA